jgi:hypothetical protein
MLTFSRTSQSLGINAGFAANDGSWGSKVGAHTFDELVRAVVSFGAGIFLVDDMPPQQIDEIRAAVAALDAGLQAGRGLSGFAAPEGARPSLRISAVVETPAGISPLLTEALTPTIERALAAAGFVLTIDDSDSAALTLSAVASEPKSLTLLGEGLKVVDVTATWTLRQETGSAIVAQGACKAMSVGDTSEIVLRLKGQVAACLASLLATGLVAELH